MTQTYEEVMEMEVPEVEEVPISEESKMDELLGDLNPRYFEEGMTPEKAINKLHSTIITNHSIRPY